MPDRTERERLVEAREALRDVVSHLRTSRKGSIGATNNVYLPQIDVAAVDRWADILAAADLLSEKGEPARWETEREGGWGGDYFSREAAVEAVRTNLASTGRIRPLYPGPVQEAEKP